MWWNWKTQLTLVFMYYLIKQHLQVRRIWIDGWLTGRTKLNLTVANSPQNVIAFGDCSTVMKLFIFQCLVLAVLFFSLASLISDLIHFILQIHQCIHSPSQVSAQSVHLLPVCPPQCCKQEAALSTKIKIKRAECCLLLFRGSSCQYERPHWAVSAEPLR